MSDKKNDNGNAADGDNESEAVNEFPGAGCTNSTEGATVEGESNEVKGEFSNKSPNQFDSIGEYWRLLAFRKDEDKHLWRKQYLQKSFYLVGFALYFSFFILMMVGVGLVDLSTTVLVTLLGSTVAEVIGILLVAFNWLYPNSEKCEKEVEK